MNVPVFLLVLLGMEDEVDRFIELLRDHSPLEAARRLGYYEHESAQSRANRLLADPRVQEAQAAPPPERPGELTNPQEAAKAFLKLAYETESPKDQALLIEKYMKMTGMLDQRIDLSGGDTRRLNWSVYTDAELVELRRLLSKGWSQ